MYNFRVLLFLSLITCSLGAKCPVDESKHDFSGNDFSKQDFSACKFTHKTPLVFKKATLTNAVFTKMNGKNCSFGGPVFKDDNSSALSGADFSGANLEGANLACGLDVSNAKFIDSNLKNVRADWSMFNNSVFDGADFTNANFTNTDIEGSQFTSKKSSKKAPVLDGASFAASVVNYATKFANNCSMIGTNFSNSFGDGVLFENVTMYMALMSGLQIDGLRIINSDARSSSFKDLSGNDPSGTHPIKVDTKGHKPSFEGTDFAGSFFDGSLLKNVNFSETSVEDIDFSTVKVPTSCPMWRSADTYGAKFKNFNIFSCNRGFIFMAVPLSTGGINKHVKSSLTVASTKSVEEIKKRIETIKSTCTPTGSSYCVNKVKALNCSLNPSSCKKTGEQVLDAYKKNEANRPHLIVQAKLQEKIKNMRDK